MGFGFAVGVVGVLILSRAAYSTIKGLMKIVEEEFAGPPITVVGELVIALVLCMWATLTVQGRFLSIHPDSEENRIVSLPENLDYMIFDHRGRVFPSQVDLKLKH